MDYIRSLFYAHSMQNRFLLNLEFLVTQIKLISDDEPILVFECNSIPEVGDFSSFFFLLKVEIVLKGSLGVVNKLLKTKSLLTSPSNVFPFASSKLSCQQFEFSLKVKLMALNPGYLVKTFLL